MTDKRMVSFYFRFLPLLIVFLLLSDLAQCKNSEVDSLINHKDKNLIDISYIDKLSVHKSIPNTLIVLPEQVLPGTIAIGIAAIFNESNSYRFYLADPIIVGNNITIDTYGIDTNESYPNLTIQSEQTTISNLSVGDYHLEITNNLLGYSLYNTTFSIRPFGEIFKEEGVAVYLETYRGGIVNDSIYLVPSPLNPVCPPLLFNYTNFWANSTDQFILAFNISTKSRNITNISISFQNESDDQIITPSNISVELLQNNSSILIPFSIETYNMKPNISNLTYNLSYFDGTYNISKSDALHMGIFQMNTSIGDNYSINKFLITPFIDNISQSEQEWVDIDTGKDRSISYPSRVLYNASYSNFTLTEARSPWVHILVGSVISGLLGASAEVAHQCVSQQHKSATEVIHGECNIDWTSTAVKGIEAGAAWATYSTIGWAALPARMIACSSFSSGILELVSQSTEMVGGKRSEFDINEIGWASAQGSVNCVALVGAGKLAASYKLVQNGIAHGKYQSGSWKKIGELGKSARYSDKLTAAYEYLKRCGRVTSVEYEIILSIGTSLDKLSSREGQLIISQIFKENSKQQIELINASFRAFSPLKRNDGLQIGNKNWTLNNSSDINKSILLLIDASESMTHDNKIEKAKELSKIVVFASGQNDEVAIMVISDCYFIPLIQSFTTNKLIVANKIDSIRSGSSTPLYSAISKANSYINESSKYCNREIILITDGEDTCPA